MSDGLLWMPDEMAELMDALANSADKHTNSYSETAHLCRNAAETIRHLDKENDALRKLLDIYTVKQHAGNFSTTP